MSAESVYDEPSHSSAPQEQPGFDLSTRQRQISDELIKLDEALCSMYLGSLRVIQSSDNPDRLAQAAHSLRELMEKLAAPVGAPVGNGPSLKEKVRQLRDLWPEGGWSRSFDGEEVGYGVPSAFHTFLEKCKAFFTWFDMNNPSRREEFASLLASRNPGKRRLVPPIEKLNVNRWIKLRDDLLAVAHHGLLWQAAWNAYIRFRRVYGAVYDLLSEEYARAVERCGEYPMEDRESREEEEGLANHIMILGSSAELMGGFLRHGSGVRWAKPAGNRQILAKNGYRPRQAGLFPPPANPRIGIVGVGNRGKTAKSSRKRPFLPGGRHICTHEFC